jgi:hypothetical protein
VTDSINFTPKKEEECSSTASQHGVIIQKATTYLFILFSIPFIYKDTDMRKISRQQQVNRQHRLMS